MHDVIIIGAGPAGLTAATNTAHRGLKTLVIEQYEKAGGQPMIFYPDKIIKDHPGFPIGVLAKEFARRMEMQARNAGAKIRLNEEVLKIIVRDDFFEIKTTNSVYLGKKVILCTGMLSIPNKLPQLKDCKNVLYKIENVVKNKKVAVIGGGDNAFDSALQLKDMGADLTIIINHSYAKAKESTVKEAEKSNIQIMYDTELVDVFKDDQIVKKLILKKKSVQSEMHVDYVFSAIGFSQLNTFLKENNLKQNKDGSIRINDRFETSTKGIFAAGDITGEVKLIAVACAEGIVAAINAFGSIKKPFWLN